MVRNPSCGKLLELLKKEIPKKQNSIKSVHLCFTTDPFMVGYPEVTEMSLEIIRLLDYYGIKCTTLTKEFFHLSFPSLTISMSGHFFGFFWG